MRYAAASSSPLTLGVTQPQIERMWHYLTFVPCGLALLAQVALLTGTTRRKPTPQPWQVSAALWLAAWLTTVILLYARSDAALFSGIVLQREAGYWLGSATTLSLPFLALAALRHFMLVAPQAAPRTARNALAVVAAAGWLLAPGLFSAGWVAGCVFAGYASCM